MQIVCACCEGCRPSQHAQMRRLIFLIVGENTNDGAQIIIL